MLPLMIHSDAFLTQLTWQVLIEGYFTSLLLVHQLTFGLDDLIKSIKHDHVMVLKS